MQIFQDTFETRKQSFICAFSICMTPANTDVFKTSSGRLGKVTMSSNVVKTSGKRGLIYDILQTSDLRRLEVAWFTTSWRRPIYVVLKTSNLRCLEEVCKMASEDVWLTTSWRRPIYVVLRTSNLRRLQDVWFTTSWGRLIYDVLKTSDLCSLENIQFTTSLRRL